MEDPYTELIEAWEDIRAKPNSLEPELVGEMLTLAHEVSQWLKQGENDKFRATLEDLRGHAKRTALPRKGVYEIAVTMMDGMPFTVDDPEYPDEPFAIRCWRTVEEGFTVMDAKLAADPNFRAYPRMEWEREPSPPTTPESKEGDPEPPVEEPKEPPTSQPP